MSENEKREQTRRILIVERKGDDAGNKDFETFLELINVLLMKKFFEVLFFSMVNRFHGGFG